MFYMENVRQCMELINSLEQKRSCFSHGEKQDIYRIALHMPSYQDIEKLLLQMAAPQAGEGERKRMIRQYLVKTPGDLNPTAVQIQNYIFQMLNMTREKEKANHKLEALMKRNDIQYDLDTAIQQLQAESRHNRRIDLKPMNKTLNRF